MYLVCRSFCFFLFLPSIEFKNLFVCLLALTSSNFFVIKENALKIAFVEPDTVTMRSGHDPSDILIVAPDWNEKEEHVRKP